MPNKVIIITGLSASGKTSIGRDLANILKIPLVSRDDLKELMFDNLGWSDREWSKKVGRASYALLWRIADSLLKSGASFIVESNFSPESDSQKFVELQKKYSPDFVQILCSAEGSTLLSRFKERAESRERHPGHDDMKNLEEFGPMLMRGRIDFLNVPGKRIEVDTTDFTKVNVAELSRLLC